MFDRHRTGKYAIDTSTYLGRGAAFFWSDGLAIGHEEADFKIGECNDTIKIDGVVSEKSARMLQMLDRDADGTVAYPLLLKNYRFGTGDTENPQPRTARLSSAMLWARSRSSPARSAQASDVSNSASGMRRRREVSTSSATRSETTVTAKSSLRLRRPTPKGISAFAKGSGDLCDLVAPRSRSKPGLPDRPGVRGQGRHRAAALRRTARSAHG